MTGTLVGTMPGRPRLGVPIGADRFLCARYAGLAKSWQNL